MATWWAVKVAFAFCEIENFVDGRVGGGGDDRDYVSVIFIANEWVSAHFVAEFSLW